MADIIPGILFLGISHDDMLNRGHILLFQCSKKRSMRSIGKSMSDYASVFSIKFKPNKLWRKEKLNPSIRIQHGSKASKAIS